MTSTLDSNPMGCNNSSAGEVWCWQKRLGRGSYGIVSLWKGTSSGEFIAVKQYEVQGSTSDSLAPKWKKNWRDEVERMYNIRHKNIVTTIAPPLELLDALKKDKPNYPNLPPLCMEYCKFGDLRHLLWRPENLNGLRENDILTFLSHISSAIKHLHKNNIYHRDIKPENILIQISSSGEAVYKLSDLGLAKDVSSQESLCSTFSVGTEKYLAPEIINRKKYNGYSDYFSFGLIVYEICCGKLPIQYLRGTISNNPDLEIPCDIPRETHLSEFFRKCLSIIWLPSMLKVNPENRGRIIRVRDGVNEHTPLCSLKWLQNLLASPTLEIHSPLSGRNVFRVRENTTIAELKTYINNQDEKESLKTHDQLLLSEDGKEVTSDKIAMKYAKFKTKLYLVPKTGEQVDLKMLLSPNVNDFLQDVNKPFEQDAKLLWKHLIFHMQSELERMENHSKAFQALKTRQSKIKTSLTVSPSDTKKMTELELEFREKRASLNAIMGIVKELEDMDEPYISNHTICSLGSLSELTTKAEDLQIRVDIAFQEYFKYQSGEAVYKNTNLQILRELCDKVIREYQRWKEHEKSSNTDTAQNADDVRRILSSFQVAQEKFLLAYDHNIKLLLFTLRDHVPYFQEKFRAMDELQARIKAWRLKKQQLILRLKSPPGRRNSF